MKRMAAIVMGIVIAIACTAPAVAYADESESGSITLNVIPNDGDQPSPLSMGHCSGVDSKGIQRDYCGDIYEETWWRPNPQTGKLEKTDYLGCSWVGLDAKGQDRIQCGDTKSDYCIWVYDLDTLDPMPGAVWHNKTLGDATSDKDGKMCWHRAANPPAISPTAGDEQVPQFDGHDEAFTQVKPPTDANKYYPMTHTKFITSMTSSGRVGGASPPDDWSAESQLDWTDQTAHICGIRYRRKPAIQAMPMTGKQELAAVILITGLTTATIAILTSMNRTPHDGKHHENGAEI